jgi:hypothetical protein
MSRRARGIIVLVIAVLGAVVLLLYSQSFQTCIYPNTHDYQGNPLQKEYWSVIHLWGWCFTGAIHEYAEVIAAIATIAIAWFTLSRRESTDKLWEAGERQIRAMRQSVFVGAQAAKAAKKQAAVAERSFTELETPFLYPVVIGQVIDDAFKYFERYDHPASPVTPVSPHAEVVIRNYGRTPALLRGETMWLEQRGDTFADPDFDFIFSEQPPDAVLEPGAQSSQPIKPQINPPIDKASHAKLKAEETYLFLRGTIWFADIFGGEWIQTFSLRWDYERRCFRPADAKYNQRKRNPSQHKKS